ncbi:MAG: SRPBCC family protein [Pirellulales bacterium]
MSRTHKLQVITPSDRELCLTRVFEAPRHLVFAALSKPELVRRWLGGLPGWSMTVCEIDFRVGGRYRYVWKHENGSEMGMGGEYLEITPPERIVNSERFDQAWYDGSAEVTIVLTEAEGRTTLVETVRYDSREIRDQVLKTPMEQGVAVSFDHLEDLVTAG